VLPIFGGIFLDKIGMRSVFLMLNILIYRAGIILFSIILTIGQAVYMIGGYAKSYWVMLLGRVIFG